jgi:hypothetical protein
VRYTIKNPIETDVDTYWGRVFFDPEFNRSLFVECLGFTRYEVLEERRDADGTIHKRVECVPKVELPAAARKIFGQSAGYTEIGTFDPKTKKYRVEVIANMAADKIKTHSEIWVEPRGGAGDKRCERIVTVDNTVKVFGLGTLLEGFIEQQTRDSYNRGADFTNRWIRDHSL